MSFAGGFVLEDHLFKGLALGAPFTKLICMGRGIMIPGFVGSNIEGALNPDQKAKVNGHWSELPKIREGGGQLRRRRSSPPTSTWRRRWARTK